MTVAADGRTEVLRHLERAYERHAVQEQLLRTVDPEGSQVHHDTCVRLLRARMAEEDESTKLPPPLVQHCLTCAAAYAARGR